MKRLALAAAVALTLTAATSAHAAEVINVNGSTNASLDGAHSVSTTLAAGTYRLSFINDAFTAFSRFSSSSGCNAAGANCVTGYENSVRYIINGVTFLFGDSDSSGVGPAAGGGYYDTEATSFANSGMYGRTLVLAAPTTIDFFLYDDNLGDNRGGVSLAIAAVPEPAVWVMMLMGFAMVGAGLRSRKPRSVSVSYA